MAPNGHIAHAAAKQKINNQRHHHSLILKKFLFQIYCIEFDHWSNFFAQTGLVIFLLRVPIGAKILIFYLNPITAN